MKPKIRASTGLSILDLDPHPEGCFFQILFLQSVEIYEFKDGVWKEPIYTSYLFLLTREIHRICIV